MVKGEVELTVETLSLVSVVALLFHTMADGVVIVATWKKTYEIVRLQMETQLWSRGSIALLLLRDGAWSRHICRLHQLISRR